MESIDLIRIRRRVRLAYEFGRFQWAIFGIAPVALLVCIAMCFVPRPISTLWFGMAIVVIGATMLWYGRDPQRAVLPGVIAGLIPLVLALCANNMHMCGAEGCTTLCVPACVLGGVVAGLLVTYVGHLRRAGLLFLFSASVLALLTGAMGCSCVGFSGIIGLGIGFWTGVVPVLLRMLFSRKTY